jgi:hypothetical protein
MPNTIGERPAGASDRQEWLRLGTKSGRQEKSPAQRPGLKVWERMPERHFAYAAINQPAQVRKQHIKLQKMQFIPFFVTFCAKVCL